MLQEFIVHPGVKQVPFEIIGQLVAAGRSVVIPDGACRDIHARKSEFEFITDSPGTFGRVDQ